MARHHGARFRLGLLVLLTFAPAAPATTVSNTAPRRTRDGTVVGAQDGNLVNRKWRGQFALVGMSYGDCVYDGCANQTFGACGFGAGRLLVWTSPTLGDGTWSEPFEILPAADRPGDAIYFRPHLAWNPRTGQWVLWVRWLPVEGPRIGDDPDRYLSATSDNLTGPYVVAQRNVSMRYGNSADDNLFVDDDGTGYIVHNARATHTKIVVEQLTPDMTQMTGHSSELIGPGLTEAPAMFKRGGVYYVTMGTLCCYCTEGRETLVYRSSESPLGPYVADGSLGNAPGAQQNFVFPWVVRNDASDPLGPGRVLWSGNRWGSDPLHTPPLFDHSLQYWSVLTFQPNGTVEPIVWQDAITLPRANGGGRGLPKLAATGPAEIVFNKTRDHCCRPSDGACLNWAGHVGEQPDSVPTAWHNPRTNTSYLISATSWGHFATIGASLSTLRRHDCDAPVFTAANRTSPASFANNQWLQSARVFPNGSGVALIHNEFHGEQVCRGGDCQYCSFDRKVGDADCVLWSTDLGRTDDGGATWKATHSPLFAVPRRYKKDQPISGYGALGALLYHETDGFYYGHVARSHPANVPNGTAMGFCTFRTRTPAEPTSYRGWNGTAWATRWVDPYNFSRPVPEDELWQYECALAETHDESAHPSPRFLAQGVRQRRPDWPKAVMLGWPEGRVNTVSYSFPKRKGGQHAAETAPFTAWGNASFLNVDAWLDPHLFADTLMYPTVMDHDSPFSLLPDGDDASAADRATALSYGLLGNKSMYLYFVVARGYIARLPVAWFDADAPVPRGPYPPAPPIAAGCRQLEVVGAGMADANGVYTRANDRLYNNRSFFEKDDGHQLYCTGPRTGPACRWTLAHYAHPPTFYEAGARSEGAAAPPPEGWTAAASQAGVAPFPVVRCVDPEA